MLSTDKEICFTGPLADHSGSLHPNHICYFEYHHYEWLTAATTNVSQVPAQNFQLGVGESTVDSENLALLAPQVIENFQNSRKFSKLKK
jgi:hypothetical protein